MYNEGFVSSDGPTQDRDLAGDAVWLAGVVATSLPAEAEAWGLAALLSFQHARAAARFDDRRLAGAAARPGPVPLGPPTIPRRGADARPGGRRCTRRGRFQLQAAIAACHATSPSWAETDWLQIVTLYDVLGSYDPSPVVRLNRGHRARAARHRARRRGAGRGRRPRRPARRLPPLPRHPRRAAHRPGSRRRGRRSQRPRPRPDRQRGRAPTSHDPPAPPPPDRRHLSAVRDPSRVRCGNFSGTEVPGSSPGSGELGSSVRTGAVDHPNPERPGCALRRPQADRAGAPVRQPARTVSRPVAALSMSRSRSSRTLRRPTRGRGVRRARRWSAWAGVHEHRGRVPPASASPSLPTRTGQPVGAFDVVEVAPLECESSRLRRRRRGTDASNRRRGIAPCLGRARPRGALVSYAGSDRPSARAATGGVARKAAVEATPQPSRARS